MSSLKIRRHTIVAGAYSGDWFVAQLEKDWFDYRWVTGWEVRHVITRPQGEFHVVSARANFTRKLAERMVDAAISGQIRTIDLRDFAVTIGAGKNARK